MWVGRAPEHRRLRNRRQGKQTSQRLKPRSNLRGKGDTRRVEGLQPAASPGGPAPAAPRPAVRVGGGSQARATRTALWEEEAIPDWGLGLEVPSGQPGCHGHRDKERG